MAPSTKPRSAKSGPAKPGSGKSGPGKPAPSSYGPNKTKVRPTVRVLDEGPHHVVVDKPPGILVVRARGSTSSTLLDLVTDRYGKGIRPVHRLDRGTSGCCAFARTPFGEQALTDAFRKRLVDKRYVCVVEGEPDFRKRNIDARLLRVDDQDARSGPLAWQTVDDAGQHASTRIEVLASAGGLSLVEARPQTGRMHQIRVHLAHVGHPIVGDALYGAEREFAANHVALHAFLLSLPLPGGGRCFVAADVPAALRELTAGMMPSPKAALQALKTKFLERQTSPPKRSSPDKGKPATSKPGPARAKNHNRGGGGKRGGNGRGQRR